MSNKGSFKVKEKNIKKSSLKFTNNYYYKYKKINNLGKVDYNKTFDYSFRLFFFYKIINFLNKFNIKKNFFLKIMFNHFNFLWIIFLQLKNINYFYYLVKNTLQKYRSLYINNNFFFKNLYITNSYINFYNIKTSSVLDFKYSELKYFHRLNLKFKQNDLNLTQVFYKKIVEFKQSNFENSNFIINFLRIQRRYNKRRYSKVRVTSRPSFFAGISLSSIFLGLLWGGSIKSTDWLTTFIIEVDINLFIFILINYFIFRVWKLNYLNFIRKKNKIKTINIIHKMFIFKIFLTNAWK